MLLPHGAVIALIDGKTLELYRNDGNEAKPELAALATPTLDAHNHSGASHHSRPGNHADQQVIEDSHAIAAAAWLNSQVLSQKITDLVIFAPPRTLGELRKHYHKLTVLALRAELDKDMNGRQPSAIIAALRAKN